MKDTSFKTLLYTCTVLLFFLSISVLELQASQNVADTPSFGLDLLATTQEPPSVREVTRVVKTPIVAGYSVRAALQDLMDKADDTSEKNPLSGGTVSTLETGCTDSDNGVVKYVKGETCIDGDCVSDRCSSRTQFVRDFWCEDGQRSSGEIYCGFGNICSDGVCVPQDETNYTPLPAPTPTTTCTDSDGGRDLFTKGVTKGVNHPGVYIEVEDKCQSATTDWGTDKEQYVAEFFCLENTGQPFAASDAPAWVFPSYRNKCEYGCFDGRCLTKEEADDLNDSEDTTPPSQIKLSVKPVSGNQIDLLWTESTDDSGIAYYRVMRALAGADMFTALASTQDTTYSDTTVQPDTTYVYTVEVYDTVGNNSRSPEQSVTTPDDGDDNLDEPNQKVIVCHRNRGAKQFVQLIISRSGWERGHSHHDGDFIKEGEGNCWDTTVNDGPEPFNGGFTDGPRDIPGLDREPQTLDDNNSDSGPGSREERKDRLIAELKARIAKLRIKISTIEDQIVKREKQFFKRLNRELIGRVGNRLLLDPENNGEVSYVDSLTESRYFVHRENAFDILKTFASGITSENIDKFAIGIDDRVDEPDEDGDGIPDKLEELLGSDPADADTDDDGFSDGTEIANNFSPTATGGRLPVDEEFACQHEGKFFLVVEGERAKGHAFYIKDCKRWYMNNPKAAYDIMRFQSLGASTKDLRGIPLVPLGEAAN